MPSGTSSGATWTSRTSDHLFHLLEVHILALVLGEYLAGGLCVGAAVGDGVVGVRLALHGAELVGELAVELEDAHCEKHGQQEHKDDDDYEDIE